MTRVTRRKPAPDPLDGIDEGRLEGEAGDADALEQLEEAELHAMLARALERLPERYRTVVTLFYVQEMKLDEVATVLGLPEGTVKTHLFRARTQLKSMLTTELKSPARVA